MLNKKDEIDKYTVKKIDYSKSIQNEILIRNPE